MYTAKIEDKKIGTIWLVSLDDIHWIPVNQRPEPHHEQEVADLLAGKSGDPGVAVCKPITFGKEHLIHIGAEFI